MVVALQFGASASAFAAFGRPSLASDDHAVHHRNLRILGIWENWEWDNWEIREKFTLAS